MSLLNVSLPRHFYAFVRAEFLYDLQSHEGITVPAVVFGAASQRGRALSFHVVLDDGAQFAHVPIHGICHKAKSDTLPLSELQLWDCFGDEFSVIEFDYLRELDVTAFLKSGPLIGTYVCTFDWLNNGFSDTPEQHKDMHLIALENGCYCLMPNNRLRWRDDSFIEPFKERPGYLTNTRTWHAEGN